MKRLCLIVLVLSFTFTTTAVDKDDHYMSVGSRSCGEWVNSRKDESSKNYFAILGWVSGYISSFNQMIPDVYNILGSTDMESIYLWMDKYCQENPLSNMAYGMRVITDELWPKRKRTK